uniref:Uncharacterized protein n=1 Tax=Candidatus Methanophaga sp. ANME-1 ERB7 TaxID=2759913 RepID=A0A7G9ZC48_9EURY|nr:hypothetical protein BICGGCBA_00018 [Methanosarcinales archaeon ANME-1 ERB7]
MLIENFVKRNMSKPQGLRLFVMLSIQKKKWVGGIPEVYALLGVYHFHKYNHIYTRCILVHHLSQNFTAFPAPK